MADRNEGCCRAAVHSEGFAHDHAEWLAEVESLRTQLAEVTQERDEARADAVNAYHQQEATSGRIETVVVGDQVLTFETQEGSGG